MCVGVKILNFVYFGVKKSGISVSAENGAGVNKNTNISPEAQLSGPQFAKNRVSLLDAHEMLTLDYCHWSL